MDDREMPVTRTYDLSLVAKGLLICATLVLATETPLRYAIALSDPARAADVDLQWLIGCPRATIVIGTIAAVVPMDVPAINRVRGMMATTRIMNGVDRSALTTRPMAWFATTDWKSSPRPLVARKMPRGRPTIVPIMAEAKTM